MGVLKRLSSFNDDSNNRRYVKGSYPLSKVVTDVTKEILNASPEIVVNAYYDDKQRSFLENRILNILDKQQYFAMGSKRKMIKSIFDFMFGYGQLQEYIEDDDITDIDGVRFDCFSITKNGIREPADINFCTETDFYVYCKLIALRNGGILNENDSHCRVADIQNKLRINISIYPRNISGPAISIRKHRKSAFTMENLKDLGMLDDACVEILEKSLLENKTIIMCGKGGSGKTTLLRALINILPEMERVLIVESDAEIYPDKKYCIEQRVKRYNEGGNPINLDMLIKDGLTMSLDTYCVGEIVGNEAMAFLNACCSGHRFLTTMHADKPQDCVKRLIALAKGSNGISDEKMLLGLFAEGVDCIVFLEDFKVLSISNVIGTDIPLNTVVYEKVYQRSSK
ncbi:MAG TPA: ATPase, T2SS/T4P/T4SS family [Clostridia bacterium]|jgi:pilus assembly protein CpaF|nr:MAG: putative conjugal transfer protein [Firmicutes bacterium ADurb.Bin146]HOD93713.1 ATPase, T2SS/T4P/T4SS family [Clostridia bacterium]HQM39713.1 ATPase, T2SS/T4P/T4SS family [Clostridia bacterium]